MGGMMTMMMTMMAIKTGNTKRRKTNTIMVRHGAGITGGSTVSIKAIKMSTSMVIRIRKRKKKRGKTINLQTENNADRK